MSETKEFGASKTFKASTAKEVLSLICRELGPDAVISAHRKYRNSEGGWWHEATASPRPPPPFEEEAPAVPSRPSFGFRLRTYLLSALVIISLSIAGVWLLKHLPGDDPAIPAPGKLSIAVMGFQNNTGDDSYDYLNKVIPSLLITRLEQSGIFDVASLEWIEDLRKYSGEGPNEAGGRDRSLEICRKNKIDILVTGSFTKAGGLFGTDVKVLDVKTKRIRRAAATNGLGVESLLESQIDELGAEISRGLGFPDGDVGGHPFRVADITTNSIDAYYHFLRGRECYSDENLKDARLFLEKAVQLDPQFAMAHLYLASSLNIAFERKAAVEVCEKAKALSLRATEKERLFIEGMYILIMQKDLDEGVRIMTRMVSRYPREKDSHYGLALVLLYKQLYEPAIAEFQKALELDPYDGKTLGLIATAFMNRGDFETALAYYERQAVVSPKNGRARMNMAAACLELGRLGEALAMCDEGLQADPDLIVGWVPPYVYAMNENYDGAVRLAGLHILTHPFNYFHLGFYHYWAGAWQEAQADLRKLTGYAASTGSRQSEADALWLNGWIAFDRNEFDLSRASFSGWFDIYRETVLPKRSDFAEIRNYWAAWHAFYLGLADAAEGRTDAAKSRLGEIRSLLDGIPPDYKNWIAYYAHFLEAEVCLAEGDAEKAILVCKKSPPMGWWIDFNYRWFHNVPFLRDVLARAYRRKGDLGKSAAEYERLIRFDPKGKERNLIHPKYYFRLGEVQEEMGDEDNAAKNYERFLGLWKNADPDIPEVVEAKKRLARFKDETSRRVPRESPARGTIPRAANTARARCEESG